MIYYLSIIYGSHAIFVATIHLCYLLFLSSKIYTSLYISIIYLYYLLSLIYLFLCTIYLWYISLPLIFIIYYLFLIHYLWIYLLFLLYIIYLSSITYLLSIIYLHYCLFLIFTYVPHLSIYRPSMYLSSITYVSLLSVCLSICWFSCRTLFNTCLSKNHTLYAQTGSKLPLTPSSFSAWHDPVCFLYVAISSDHHNKVSGFSRLVFAMIILYRGGSRLGQVGHDGWSHTTVMEQEQEHRPVLVPYVFNLSWVKPGVTGMTCICWLVSYLRT